MTEEEELMSRNKQKKGGAKKTLLALPIAALVAVVAWMQGCVGDISDALGVFSGGGASGPTADADGENDNRTENPEKENKDLTPTPAEENKDGEGNQAGKDIQIVVNGTDVKIDGVTIPYDANNPVSFSGAVSSKLSELIADDREVYLNDQNGDYNVTEEIRKVLTALGITPAEQK